VVWSLRNIFRYLHTAIVFCGDFNAKVDSILSSRRIGEKEATFCLLDQRTFECHWSTVKKLLGIRPENPTSSNSFTFSLGGGTGAQLQP